MFVRLHRWHDRLCFGNQRNPCHTPCALCAAIRSVSSMRITERKHRKTTENETLGSMSTSCGLAWVFRNLLVQLRFNFSEQLQRRPVAFRCHRFDDCVLFGHSLHPTGGAPRRRWLVFGVCCQTQPRVTWLILPVVICLSQRLSHACLSINNFIL